MPVRIVYPSALEYWLWDKGVPYRFNAFPENEEVVFGKESLRALIQQMNFSSPVSVGVSRNVNRKKDKEILCRVIPKNLPENSFVEVANGVFVASPAMCLLQAAGELPMHKLVQLANNLCAMYVLDPYEYYGQRRREPVTSVEEITNYLQTVRNVHHVREAETAIRYALNRSNSPRETELSTVGFLPWKYGGYGVKTPTLNLDIGLSDTGAEHLGRKTCCCDMVWLEEKVVLEYDSNLTHLSPTQHAKDKRRITALSLSGYQVISVTADDVRSFRSVEELFLRIRKTLGMQTDPARVQKYFDIRWDVVHDIMKLEK